MCSAAFVKRGFAAASAAFMGVGAYLLVHPGLLPAVCTLLGVVFVSYGAVKLMGYFSDDLYRLAFQFDLGVGILTILVGCVLLLRPRDRLALLPMVIGAFVLVDSVLRLQTALDARHFGMEKWWVLLAAAAAGAGMGALLLLLLVENGRSLTRLLGLTLLVDGGENLLACLYTVKVPRRAGPDEDGAPSERTADPPTIF